MTRPRKTSGRLHTPIESAILFTLRTTDRLGNKAIKYMTTDHSGLTKAMINMPTMGFVDTLFLILVQFIAGLVGAIVTGVLYFLLIGFGIPYLITGHL
jgi:hypothetical protein